MRAVLAQAAAQRPRRSPMPVLSSVLRRCGEHGCPPQGCEERRADDTIWRSASGAAEVIDEVPPIVREVLRSGGEPLAGDTRTTMEARFGQDFSHVRIHTDARAAESAAAIRSLAYTVGGDIVFASGRYQDRGGQGLRVLAHELAHVAQLSGGTRGASGDLQMGSTHDPAEAEADRAAAAVVAGSDVHEPARGGDMTLRRDPDNGGPGAEELAERADVACDIPALCRLKRTASEVVSDGRVIAAARRCRPGTPITMDPCLSPAFMLPPIMPGPVSGPGRPSATPGGPSPTPAGGSSIPGLSGLTTFRFNAGPVRFNVDLPSSIVATLPAPLAGSTSIEFSLSGAASGSFSFSATLNGLRHVRIAATAGVDVSAGRGTAGLTITTTRTVCRAAEPTTLRQQIIDAGAKLQTAINAWQSPPSTPPGGTPPTTADRLMEIASRIGELYKAVDKAKKPCEQVPVVSVGVTGGTQLFEPPGATPGTTPGGSSTGVGVTFHF
jgi:Domain of unknown function (DUF4157)